MPVKGARIALLAQREVQVKKWLSAFVTLDENVQP